MDANLGSFDGTVIKNPARNIFYINLPKIRECFMILEPLWAGIFSAIGQFNMVTTTSHNGTRKKNLYPNDDKHRNKKHLTNQQKTQHSPGQVSVCEVLQFLL